MIYGISDPHAGDDGVVSLIEDVGAKWVRAEFHWSIIEPVPGAGYNWSAYDKMVDAYAAKGIQVAAILTYIPNVDFDSVRALKRAWGRFVKKAVLRYSGKGVKHWEIFNEPNLPGYGWLTKGYDARENLGLYATLLKKAAQKIRQCDPEAKIILGGLASESHRAVPAEETMDILYAKGIKGSFDIFAFHPYGYQNKFDQARQRVDAILAAHGDTGKPVWFNEYGWTDQVSMDMSINPYADKNPMLAAMYQARDTCDAFFWFSGKDYSAQPGTPTFGLADFDLNRRPSFNTFKAMLEWLEAN